jgi:hypothetical protein
LHKNYHFLAEQEGATTAFLAKQSLRLQVLRIERKKNKEGGNFFYWESSKNLWCKYKKRRLRLVRKVILVFIIVSVIVGGILSHLYCLGISTDFNNIFIENLPIGQEYDLSEDFGLPFKASYSGAQKAKIKIEPVYPSNLKPGFESIPDTNWILIPKTEILVDPQQPEVFADIKIKIPNDKTLLGKKFQVNIRCYVTSFENAGVLAVTPGVEGSLLFSISPEDKPKKFKRVDLNFEVEPKEIFKKIVSTETFVGEVTIDNLTKKKYIFTVNLKNPLEVNVRPKQGYELLPENFVTFSPKELVIKGKERNSFKIDISSSKIVPGKYFGLIEIQTATKNFSKSRYIKLYLEIE